jgi:hypothetical protein
MVTSISAALVFEFLQEVASLESRADQNQA